MGPTADELAAAGVPAPGSDSAGARRQVEPTPGAVRKPDFFDRKTEVEGDVVLVCPECRYEFNVPIDWCDDHRGEHVGCPGCSLSSRLPASPAVAGLPR